MLVSAILPVTILAQEPFWLKPFLSNVVLLSRMTRFGCCVFAVGKTSRHATPRLVNDGDGWLQVFTRPRPQSEMWPRRTANPSEAQHTKKTKKLEKALEVMSDVEAPALDALRAELKKVQNAAAVLPLDVQMEQCESFISRSQRRLAELEKQREEVLTEAKTRLERLRLGRITFCNTKTQTASHGCVHKSWICNVPQPQFFPRQPQCGWEMVHSGWTMFLHCPLPTSRTWNIG